MSGSRPDTPLQDAFFGPAFTDVDEWRDTPVRHRYVHGGFTGTDTRFSVYLPDPARYEGRFLQLIEGGVGGHETTAMASTAPGGPIEFASECGAYLVESNQGHIGLDVSVEPTVMGYRASAATARHAKHIARETYGAEPHHGYLYGGSGGALRSIACIENVPGLWDGAVPFVAGAGPTPGMWRVGMSALANVQRVLGPKLDRVVDAIEPGGTGDPFSGLTSRERDALLTLYRAGFPRGAEIRIASHGQAPAMFAWDIATFAEFDPTYFDDFWSLPGYLGGDGELYDDLIDARTRVTRVVTQRELAAAGGGAAFAPSPDAPVGIVIEGVDADRSLGLGMTFLGGDAVGRELFCVGHTGDMLLSTAVNGPVFDGVRAGDAVRVDNRKWLAFCFLHRHQADRQLAESRAFRCAGEPVYPQRPLFPMARMHSITRQQPHTGVFPGKMIIVNHMLDDYAWPNGAIFYADLVRARLAGATDEQFRLWLVDHATHIPVSMLASTERARLLDVRGCTQQAVRDLIAWVEDGVAPPASTTYSVDDDCGVHLAGAASERRGIQPVVTARANGAARAEVRVGDVVHFDAIAETPPGGGTITAVEWDFEGAGEFPMRDETVDGTSPTVRATASHAFAAPGTYFPAVRVTAHRDGDQQAATRTLPNLGRVRVVVH